MFDCIESQTKICKKCGVEKTIVEFPKRDKTSDGTRHECRTCANARHKETRDLRAAKGYPVVESKVCSSCNVEKPGTDFPKMIGSKDGLGYHCNGCVRVYQDNRRAFLKENGPTDPKSEKTCTLCKVTKHVMGFASSPMSSDGYSPACKACLAKQQKEIRAKERAKSPHQMKAKLMVNAARSRAKELSLPFDIDKEWLVTQLPDVCPALGIPINYDNRVKAAMDSPSIDKFEASLGYVKSNCFVISVKANFIKNSGNVSEVRAVADWMEGVEANKCDINITSTL